MIYYEVVEKIMNFSKFFSYTVRVTKIPKFRQKVFMVFLGEKLFFWKITLEAKIARLKGGFFWTYKNYFFNFVDAKFVHIGRYRPNNFRDE